MINRFIARHDVGWLVGWLVSTSFHFDSVLLFLGRFIHSRLSIIRAAFETPF
jgi:hypothetical protein